MTDPEHLALVCSTAGDGDAGVYAYAYDAADGTLSETASTTVEHPMYIAVHPNCERVYVANRTDGGAVSTFAVDRTDGSLRHLVDRSSEGVGPCHVSVDPTGRYAFTANYGGGTAAMYPLDDGDLGAACDVVAHEGSGADPDRQAEPHPHAAVPGPDGEFVYVPDLGTDRVEAYRIDAAADRLRPADPRGVDLPPGTGPRHLAFGPGGAYGYLVGELDSTVTTLARDADTGALTPVGAVSTVPDDASADNSPSDVHVHPAGHVYVSNRGHQSIAGFDIGGDGTLSPIGHTPTGGANPRDFALDPAGRFLLVENRDDFTVVSFGVGDDGGLRESVRRAVPKPTCLAFVRRA